jgi:hypothetical protein
MYLAIGIDSIGYQKYYQIMWKMLSLATSAMVLEHHCGLDHIRAKMKV